MVITKAAIFMHLPKTGGTWLQQVLADAVLRIEMHQPARYAPDDRPRFGFTRNPWSWYVSWYHFHAAGNYDNPVFQAAAATHGDTFGQITYGLLTAPAALKRRAYKIAGHNTTGRNQGITQATIGRWIDTEDSYLTHLHTLHLEGCERVGKAENIADDLSAMLEGIGALDDDTAARIRNTPPANTSKHSQPADYYSPDLEALVAEREADQIAAYNYG